MRVLMIMRDALPPSRPDVATLFDAALREHGICTDFAGPPGATRPSPAAAGAAPPRPGPARLYDLGPRASPAFVWRAARLAWRCAPEVDLVIARDLPLAGLAVQWACALRRRAFAAWISFPMPLGDRVGARAHWRRGHGVRALVAGLRGWLAQTVQDRWVLPRAAHVFVQSECMRERLLADLPDLPPARASAVPMGIDARALQDLPAAEEPPADSAVRSTVPVLAYLGSLDPARQIGMLLEALALLHRRGVPARLLLVGAAPREVDIAALRQQAGRLGVAEAVDFTGPLPMPEAWQRVRTADVALAAIPPGPLHDVSSPTKVVEYLALGVPVVASRIPDQEALLAACGGGRCADFDAAAFADAIDQVLAAGPAARAEAAQARAAVLRLRAYDTLAADVARVLRSLACHEPGGAVRRPLGGAT